MVHETMMTTMQSFSLSPVLVGSCITLVAAVVYLCITAWLRPRRVGKIFRRQGIDGPSPPSFLSGNLSEMQARVVAAAAEEEAGGRDFQKEGFDDYCKRIFPYFDKWRKAYVSRAFNNTRAVLRAVGLYGKDGHASKTGHR